jgi:hypothetical protein
LGRGHPSGQAPCSGRESLDTLVVRAVPGERRFRQLGLYTAYAPDLDGDGDLETIALFADGFQDFFWQWTSQGLKPAQLRFYSFPVAQ